MSCVEKLRRWWFFVLAASCCVVAPCFAQQKVSGPPLAGTQPLTMEGDIAAQMVAGIDKFLLREIELSVERREILEARFQLARGVQQVDRAQPAAAEEDSGRGG